MVDRWRATALGLPPARSVGTSLLAIRGAPVPRLYGFSEALVPRPADWTEHDHVTGYWFGSGQPDWTAPDDLVRFIASGSLPIYVGFGSMAVGNAAARTAVVVDALAIAGLRGVLGAGWGGLTGAGASSHVHAIGDAPHDWLFPRMRAVVHHGGSGTTHRGLRHGRPTLVCPLFGDQPFWGRRIVALGAGPEPLPLRRLEAASLAARLRRLVETPSYAARAAAIREEMAKEDPALPERVIEERWVKFQTESRTAR